MILVVLLRPKSGHSLPLPFFLVYFELKLDFGFSQQQSNTYLSIITNPPYI